jgi:hypothetical protein
MIYIGDSRYYNLTKDKLYIIKYIDDMDLCLVVNDDNKLVWYNICLFKKDVLEERKDKIRHLKERICIK